TRRLRHQLSVYSPVELPALLRAAYETGARGDRRAELADAIAAEYRADRVVLLGSGTQALQLALEVALHDRASPAAIALPAFCCYDVASAAVGAGRPAVLYDLDPTTLGPRLDSLEEAFRAGAGAAVIAPLY